MQYSTAVESASPVVFIIGNTVLMDGVEACLQELQINNLIHWNAINAESETDLKAYHPKLIIFERDAPSTSILFNLLKDNPGTNLLGVDCNCHHVIIMNSFQIQTRSMSDLQRIVQDLAGGREPIQKGGKN
jgi:hypothetical protein